MIVALVLVSPRLAIPPGERGEGASGRVRRVRKVLGMIVRLLLLLLLLLLMGAEQGGGRHVREEGLPVLLPGAAVVAVTVAVAVVVGPLDEVGEGADVGLGHLERLELAELVVTAQVGDHLAESLEGVVQPVHASTFARVGRNATLPEFFWRKKK